MGKFICSICGYVYDEADGVPFDQLPDQWVCPLCKAGKSAFSAQAEVVETVKISTEGVSEEKAALSTLEKSVLCSNLARGCEKQYLPEEAAHFTALANYFKAVTPELEQGDMDTLRLMVEEDLATHIPLATAVAEEARDRGALRALTWCTRVTTLLQSVAEQYGGQPLEDTGVYVCTICGFIYVGDDLPELCPVCKVPNYKFEEIKGGRS